MLEMYDEIVEFAELEKFMDQKLKNYSSGMQVRLAFSIAIRAKSDILLIDEVLAVGDSAFQRKCYEIFNELRKMKRTIVFVTHDMSAVERFCDKAAVVHKGELMGVYSPKEASLRYDQLNVEKKSRGGKVEEEEFKKKKRWGSGEVSIKELYINGELVKNKKIGVEMGKPFDLKIKLENKGRRSFVVGLRFDDGFGVNVSGPNNIGDKTKHLDRISYKIDKLSLLPGDYKLSIVVFDEGVVNEYDHFEEAVSFVVTANQHNLYGKVNLFGKWE
jgi:energy-coupling factor transporter ATP-binding protein EcfA2